MDVLSDIVNRCVIALSARHNGLRHGNNIMVADGKAVLAGGSCQDAVHNDFAQIVALPDNRAADAAGNRAN